MHVTVNANFVATTRVMWPIGTGVQKSTPVMLTMKKWVKMSSREEDSCTLGCCGDNRNDSHPRTLPPQNLKSYLTFTPISNVDRKENCVKDAG
jgi:hypothetical protein